MHESLSRLKICEGNKQKYTVFTLYINTMYMVLTYCSIKLISVIVQNPNAHS